MASSSGRKRDKHLDTSTGEDAALDSISKRAEEMLQEKRKERDRARKIRLQELDKKQKEDEDKLDRQNTADKTGVPPKTLSSKDEHSSRRSSIDSTDSVDASSPDKDLKVLYHDLVEKYRRSMMTNAQLDNEKQALVYQVEDLKDKLDDMEESTYGIQKELKDKQRFLESEKRVVRNKEYEVQRLKDMVHQRDELLKEHKLIYIEADEPKTTRPKENGFQEHDEEADKNMSQDTEPEPIRAALISMEIMEVLSSYSPGTLEDKVRCVLNENNKLKRELNTLREDLDSEREQALKKPQKRQSDGMVNGIDISSNPQVVELQRESARQISEYKLKIQKAELDIAALEASVARLESLVRRYKEMAEESEKAEDELKIERRKLQKELREAQQQIEELETQKSHLQNRLDRIRQARKEVLGTAETLS